MPVWMQQIDWDAPEELLPPEGETVGIKWQDGKQGVGYMVWSSTYKFIVLDEDFEPVDYADGIVAWRWVY